MFIERTDQGSVTAFVVVICLSFVLCTGLIVDGSRIVGAKSHAMDSAGNAARVGAQEFLSIRSGNNYLHPSRAVAAAQRYLRAHGVSGFATCDGYSVTVTVRSAVKMTILATIGIQSKQVSATMSASPVDQ